MSISHYSIKLELSSRLSTNSCYKSYNDINNSCTPTEQRTKSYRLKSKNKIKLEYITMSDSDVSTLKHQDRFNMHASIFDGSIKLYKLKDENVRYNEELERIEDEFVKTIHDDQDTFACVLFEQKKIPLLMLLKNIFPSKNALTKVTNLRCLKQLNEEKKSSPPPPSSLSRDSRETPTEDSDYQYSLLLLNFNTAESKHAFSDKFNGYVIQNSTIQVISIKEIVFSARMFQISTPGGPLLPHNSPSVNKESLQEHVIPYLLEDPFTKEKSSTVSNIELPTCPVCLDRLDSAATGIITTNCQHSFHCTCLMKWKNSKCPVCRFTLDETQELKKCNECNSQNNLWCCLICGHVGCSRYSSKHAIDHYRVSGHCFSVDMNTSRVWDYAEDKYVHRIVQNVTDGKLVEIDSGRSYKKPSENGDSTKSSNDDDDHLEYVQLLLSQLESQQTYYENKICELQKKSEVQLANVTTESEQRVKELELRVQKNEKVYEKFQDSLELNKYTNNTLVQTLEKLKQDIHKLSVENQQLKYEHLESEERNKDLMFHLEAMSKLNDAETRGLSPATAYNGKLVIKDVPEDEMNNLEAKKRKNKKKNEKKKQKKLQQRVSTDCDSDAV